MSETTATVTELARELARLREDFLEMQEERDEALAEISVLATELEEERAAPTEGWVPASAWDKAKTALAVCDACCKERIRERDEARQVARLILMAESDLKGMMHWRDRYPWLAEADDDE
jgi:hypothetical protein